MQLALTEIDKVIWEYRLREGLKPGLGAVVAVSLLASILTIGLILIQIEL